ncbi:MAG: hypothetical protein MSJ26_08360 [Oscillospiraceae bacterium]|nr:hypothetical protein [Oscillospiraceae bacterium]
MEKEKLIKKIRNSGKLALTVLMVYMLLPLYTFVKGFGAGFSEGYSSAESASFSVSGLIAALLMVIVLGAGIAAVAISFSLLWQMTRDESPFTEANGRKIFTAGIMFIAAEPLYFISMYLTHGTAPDIYGLSLAAGLTLCCISAVFRYGALLQQESDETL